MSLLAKESKKANQFEIKFNVDRATFDAAVTKAFQKNSKSIRLPGFRPGKAPRAMVEKMYGKEVFYDDAIDEVLPKAYADAVEEAKIEVVGRPSITDYKVNDDAVVFTAEVYVKPELKLDGYKGMKIEKDVKKVAKKDIDEELQKVQKRNARTIEVTDRAAQMGDKVKLDYSGSVDGVKFDGGTAKDQPLELGSGTFIPGFEDQIVGKKIGEEFDVNVTFPENYGSKDLAGKAAVFACKLNAITTEELATLDDEFAKDVSEFNTLDEYKADIKKNLQEKNEKAADAAVENKVCENLINLVTVDVPDVMYDAEVENMVRDYDNNMRMQGLDLNTYLKYVNQTLDDLKVQLRPNAINQVKLRLALETIATQEKLTVAEDVIEGEYNRIATTYNVKVEEVKSMVAKEDIEKDMLVKAALDFVVASVKAPAKKAEAKEEVATEAPATEAPAKKTTTKKTATPKVEGEEAPAKKTTTKKTTAKKAD